MLCEWGTFTGSEPPVHRNRIVYAFQQSNRSFLMLQQGACTQSLHWAMLSKSCGAMLAARDIVCSEISLRLRMVRRRNHASDNSKGKCDVCNVACVDFDTISAVKPVGLAATCNNGLMPDKVWSIGSVGSILPRLDARAPSQTDHNSPEYDCHCNGSGAKRCLLAAVVTASKQYYNRACFGNIHQYVQVLRSALCK